MAAAVSDIERSRYEIIANVIETRLAAVLSKIGRVDVANKEACRRLLEDFKEDVCEALEEEDAVTLRNSLELQQELDQLSRTLITHKLIGKSRARQPSIKVVAGSS